MRCGYLHLGILSNKISPNEDPEYNIGTCKLGIQKIYQQGDYILLWLSITHGQYENYETYTHINTTFPSRLFLFQFSYYLLYDLKQITDGHSSINTTIMIES